MSIAIEEVITKKQFDTFLDLPYRLYKKGHPYNVPLLRFDEKTTLRKDKNPAFDYCEARYWLAYKNNKPVGRIAGILNKSFISKWKKKFLRFGWFDFEEDEQVATLLLLQVETWAKQLGMEAVHGPLGFTDLDHEGLLIEGFDQVATMAAIYNYPYYPTILEKTGYEKDIDWIQHRITVPTAMNGKLEKIATTVKRRYGMQVVPLKKAKDVLPYAEAVFELTNEAYSDLFGVVPLTKRQVKYYTRQYFSMMRPDFLSLVVDKEGKLAGYGVTMPSLSKALQKSGGKLFPFGFVHLLKALKKNDTADLLLVAVRKDLQGKGVNAILIHETLKSYLKNGIRYVETNHQLEDNTKVQAMWNFFESVQHKRRRCYIKYLNAMTENE